MKAIIMAGGEGSRLRPLTCNLPKPMAPLCCKPTLEYILDLLHLHDCTEAAVTVRYLHKQISDHFEESRYKDIALNFVEETAVLGTAGSVKSAVSANVSKPILIISGDALCDIDLTAAMHHHKTKKADVTIIATEVRDPREYGLINFDDEKRVVGFVEKPGWELAFSNYANTGIYIINPDILAEIPADIEYDFAKDLFPKLLAGNKHLSVYESDGYWCDIGDLDSYRTCQADILNGKVKTHLLKDDNSKARGKIFLEDSMPTGDFKIIPPVFIGANVTIGHASIIGPNAIIGDRATIGAFAKIQNSCVFEDTYIGDNSALNGAIVSSGASVKQSSQVFEGAAIGSGAIIGANAQILANVRIWPNKHIADNMRVIDNIKDGFNRPDIFDDNGICGEIGADITPEFCARLGAALGSSKLGEKVAIAYQNGRVSSAIMQTISAGALSTGAAVWDFGKVTYAQACYYTAISGINLAVYVTNGPQISIKLIGRGGMPIARSLERDIESRLIRGEFSRCNWNSYKPVSDMTGLDLLYKQELYRQQQSGLQGVSIVPQAASAEGEKIFLDTCLKLGINTSKGAVFTLSEDGTKLTIKDESAGFISADKVFAIACLIELEAGYDLVVEQNSPLIIDTIAKLHKRKVIRYLSCPCDKNSEDIRLLANKRFHLRDGLMQAIYILNYIKVHSLSVSDLLAKLPKYNVSETYFTIKATPGDILSRFASVVPVNRSGVLLRKKSGTVSLIPTKRGDAIKIIAESANAETSKELCADIVEELQEKSPL